MYGITDPRIEEEPLPFFAIPMWNIFWALHGGRQVSGMGTYQSLSYVEILAYTQLMQIVLEPWEIEIIKRMDRAFISTINTRSGEK